LEALLIAVVALVTLLGVVFLWGNFTENLKEKTGSDAGDWIAHLGASALVGIVVGGGGLALIKIGVSNDNPVVIFFGLIIAGAGLAMSWGMFRSGPD
jgi:hypothetical protein